MQSECLAMLPLLQYLLLINCPVSIWSGTVVSLILWLNLSRITFQKVAKVMSLIQRYMCCALFVPTPARHKKQAASRTNGCMQNILFRRRNWLLFSCTLILLLCKPQTFILKYFESTWALQWATPQNLFLKTIALVVCINQGIFFK